MGELSESLLTGETGSRWVLCTLVATASLGGFLFGYDTGVVSGSMIEMKSGGLAGRRLTAFEQEMIVSSAVAAAALGAWLSGLAQASPVVGRRAAILGACALFVAGALVMAAAWCVWLVLVGRVLVGLAIGVVSHTVPVYIAEMSPPHLRGSLAAANNAMTVLGQVMASVVCCLYAKRDLEGHGTQGWRWMLGLGAAPAVLMAVGMSLLPESPRWLAHFKGDVRAAQRVLVRLRGSEEQAAEELRQITAGVRTVTAPRLFSRRVYRALLLGVGLQLLQQCVGINTIMYYSSTIMQMAMSGSTSGPTHGISPADVQAVCYSAPIAASQLFGTVVGMFVCDRTGRRPLTLASLAGVCLSLVVLGFAFYGTGSDSGMLALAGMCFYLFVFGCGMSPMPWVVNAEIYPLDVRGKAAGIATAANWIANFVIAATFLDLARALSTSADCPRQHPDGAFWLYAAIAALGLLVLGALMPETMGKSLEEMDEVFA